MLANYLGVHRNGLIKLLTFSMWPHMFTVDVNTSRIKRNKKRMDRKLVHLDHNPSL